MEDISLGGIDTVVVTKFEPAGSFCDVLLDPCDGDQPLVLIGSPEYTTGAVTFIRLANLERTAAVLEALPEERSMLEGTAMSVETANPSSYCSVCHGRIDSASSAVRFRRVKREDGAILVKAAHETVDNEVWCHIDCSDELAAVLRDAWTRTDELITDLL